MKLEWLLNTLKLIIYLIIWLMASLLEMMILKLQKQKFVNMTCIRCNKTDDIPYDIYMEMLDIQDLYEESEYLKIECIYCNKGNMISTSHLKK